MVNLKKKRGGGGWNKKMMSIFLQDHTGLDETVEPRKEWKYDINMAEFVLEDPEIGGNSVDLEIPMKDCNFALHHKNAKIKMTVKTWPRVDVDGNLNKTPLTNDISFGLIKKMKNIILF